MRSLIKAKTIEVTRSDQLENQNILLLQCSRLFPRLAIQSQPELEQYC
jgi:hypothetical protein